MTAAKRSNSDKARQSAGPNESKVIVIDMDMTLLEHDTLHEQVVRIAFMPWLWLGSFQALLRGKAALKSYCAEHVLLDPAALRASREVLAFIERERAAGSRIVLCTAADRRVATLFANHLGIFDEVIATDSSTNLKGTAKADALAARFPGGFIYAGDHAADLAVWAKSEGMVLVGVKPATAKRARDLGKPVVAELRPAASPTARGKAWFTSLRPHHWSKNLLMFVPIVLAHQWTDFALLGEVLLGFVLLLAVTSASYFVNDLADLDADRLHATKQFRPIASGAIPLAYAAAFPSIVLPLALMAALALNLHFGIALAAYLAITLAYSFGLKRIPLLDTFIIGLLFTTRVVMGAAFVSAGLPVWLLTFSMFFFFSLAVAKRHVEIVRARTVGGDSLRSRGYDPEDWPLTLAMGVSSGIASLIILTLYMVDEAFSVVGYSRPIFLWAITLFLAIWVGRIWLLTHRGQMNDDPVAFALRDRPSQFLALLMGICFLIAL
jgi:4-hydroxybenzoate polyprenyltransferase